MRPSTQREESDADRANGDGGPGRPPLSAPGDRDAPPATAAGAARSRRWSSPGAPRLARGLPSGGGSAAVSHPPRSADLGTAAPPLSTTRGLKRAPVAKWAGSQSHLPSAGEREKGSSFSSDRSPATHEDMWLQVVVDQRDQPHVLAVPRLVGPIGQELVGEIPPVKLPISQFGYSSRHPRETCPASCGLGAPSPFSLRRPAQPPAQDCRYSSHHGPRPLDGTRREGTDDHDTVAPTRAVPSGRAAFTRLRPPLVVRPPLGALA